MSVFQPSSWRQRRASAAMFCKKSAHSSNRSSRTGPVSEVPSGRTHSGAPSTRISRFSSRSPAVPTMCLTLPHQYGLSCAICTSDHRTNDLIQEKPSLAAAGAVVIDVHISSWLLICTGLLALFLGLSKRRHELVILEEEVSQHRTALTGYNPRVLDQMISVVTASTVMAYALYTVSPETVAKFDTRLLGLTIPFVLYGIFRYLYLVHIKGEGGSPERSLLHDRPLLADIFLWVIAAGLILYLK